MVINFYKYQGTGNDFIIADLRKFNYEFINKTIIKLCDRKFGIGSDGLIVIKNHIEADFEMQFYNPDGTMSFCGNGSRCAVLFCFHQGIIKKNCKFITNDGEHTGEIIDSKNVKININGPCKIIPLENGDFQSFTGSPHYVRFVNNLKNKNFIRDCKLIRNNTKYKKNGINVNMVEIVDDELNIRTFERGVENETLSCGSGVTAAALCYAFLNKYEDRIIVSTKGGKLKVDFQLNNECFEDIYLTGPAQYVFKGEIDIWKFIFLKK